MPVDGMEWDVPDTDRNRTVFGVRGDDQAAFPKIRVVTVSECGSHAPVLAVMGPAAGGKGSGEQSLARKLYPRLAGDWLVIRALGCPRAAASTICARSRSRHAVFAPRTRFFKVVRSPALSMTGTAPGNGMAAPGSDHSDVIRSRARDPNRPGHQRAR